MASDSANSNRKLSSEAETLFQSAESYFNAQQFKDAEQAYKKALDLNPTFKDALLGLGCVQLNLGQLENAVASFKAAVALAPNDADGYFYLGNALDDLGKNDDAIAAIEKAISLKPDFAEAHLALGFIYFRIGNQTGLRKQYDILKNLDADFAKQLSTVIS